MNKVELAKMIGLVWDEYESTNITKWDIEACLEKDWNYIEWFFCDEKINVYVNHHDFAKDKLDIKLSDLEKDEDIKVCIKQVEDLLWERAAEEYLAIVHSVVIKIGEGW